jgi:hypothetical protein
MKMPRPMLRVREVEVVRLLPVGGQLASSITFGNATLTMAVTPAAFQFCTTQGWKSSTAASQPAANITTSWFGNALR